MAKKCDRFLCWSAATRYVRTRTVAMTMLGDVTQDEGGEFCDHHADKLVKWAERHEPQLIVNARIG